MPHLRTHARLITVGVACAGIGAGASAIAAAGATSTHQPARAAAHYGRRVHGLRMPGVRAGRAVHGDVVVSTAHGFKTVTFDRGFVQSVSGSTLTLREGTATATYRTVSLTIPADARVRNNRAAAALSSLTAGERVMVVQGLARTIVSAHSAATP